MAISGEIQTMPPADLFQWLAATQKTGVLTVSSDVEKQEYCFNLGKIAWARSATCAQQENSPDTVRRLLAVALQLPSGYFEFDEKPIESAVVGADLSLEPLVLILDVIRHMDEAHATEVALEPLPKAQPNDPPKTFSGFSEELRMAIVDRLMLNNVEVPLLPGVAQRVLAITRSDDFSFRELSDVIVTDPVMAAQLLRQANSAFYGSKYTTDSLLVAIQRLGSRTVTNIVLALSLHTMESGRERFLAEKKAIHQHSLTCALLARMIGLTVKLDAETAFLCGLMMDFGKIVVLSLIKKVMESEPSYRSAPPEVVFGIVDSYHPRVGGVVADRWKLPAAVRESITCHHALTAAKQHRAYAAVASLSDLLAGAFVAAQVPGLAAQSAPSPLSREELLRLRAAQILQMTPAQAGFILERAPECLEFASQISPR